MSPTFGPLPFPDLHAAVAPSGPPSLILPYHQAGFYVLHERLSDRIEDALLIQPVAVRARYFIGRLPMDQEVAGELAWPVARELLDALETQMAVVLRTRSVFFWMHIYRRIGVSLSPRHEDKTDPRTAALVRQVVELAITKYGRATDADEIVLSNIAQARSDSWRLYARGPEGYVQKQIQQGVQGL